MRTAVHVALIAAFSFRSQFHQTQILRGMGSDLGEAFEEMFAAKPATAGAGTGTGTASAAAAAASNGAGNS